MKKLIFIAILLFVDLSLMAQKYEVALQIGKQKKEFLELSNPDGKKMLKLPVTFQLIDKDNLVVMFGDGESLENDLWVWLFSRNIPLKEFLQKNKNVTANPKFKKANPELGVFYESKNFKHKYKFDDDYEIIKRNPKPVFFQITDNKEEKELSLYLYVSEPNKSNLNELTKIKTIKITIKILKK